MSTVFVEESVCDNCGAPLGLRRVYQSEAGESAFRYRDFQEHTESEISDDLKSIRDSGYMRLRLVFPKCSQCRNM